MSRINGPLELERYVAYFQEGLGATSRDMEILNEILSESFMRRHTQYSSLKDMFGENGYKIASAADLGFVPITELDSLVERTTHFTSWKRMLEEAGRHYMARKMMF